MGEIKAELGFIEESDLEEVSKLYFKYLNGGDYIKEQIEVEIKSKDFIGFKAKADNKIVALAYGTRGMGFTYPRKDIESDLLDYIRNYDKTFEESKIFSSDALLVLPDFRHNGLANKLMLLLRESLIKTGYKYVFVEMWRHIDGFVPAEAPHDLLGEVIYRKEYLNFYNKLIDFGITCPICGRDCKCGAQIEIIKL